MKLLIVADEESKKLWDFYEPGMLDEYDLILSAGDLSPHYLQFLVTLAHCPLYYVHGNHDVRYEKDPPEGCTCIEDQLVTYKGLRILGLGGSIRYHDGPCMYTEKAMEKRIKKLRFSIFKNRGFDILLTHAPALGVNDGPDLPHKGFACFRTLMEKYKPAYFIHGHIHQSYCSGYKRDDTYMDTHVINGSGIYVLEIPDR